MNLITVEEAQENNSQTGKVLSAVLGFSVKLPIDMQGNLIVLLLSQESFFKNFLVCSIDNMAKLMASGKRDN